MASCCVNSASSWHRCLWSPHFCYFSLEIRFYNITKTNGCLDAISGTALPLFPSLPSSPYTSIYQVPSCTLLARKYMYFKNIFLLFLPSLKLARGWVRGTRQDGEWKWQLLGAGLQAASPQGYSCEGGCMRNPEPSLCSADPGGKLAATPFQHLAASFSATCSDHWGTVFSAPTCRFRNKEWSVKVFCRHSPTL